MGRRRFWQATVSSDDNHAQRRTIVSLTPGLHSSHHFCSTSRAPGLHLHRHLLHGLVPSRTQSHGLFMLTHGDLVHSSCIEPFLFLFTRRDSVLVLLTQGAREIVAVTWDSRYKSHLALRDYV